LSKFTFGIFDYVVMSSSKEGSFEAPLPLQPPFEASLPPQPPVTAEDFSKKPWRFIGYPGFSKWMASDDDFFMLRRFDALAARVLLSLQWDLTKLETELNLLDYQGSHLVGKDIHNGSFQLLDDARRKKLDLIKEKMVEYC
jgi:hypothetical protein